MYDNVIRFVLLLYDSCCYEFLAYTSYSSELGKYLEDFAMESSFPQLKLSFLYHSLLLALVVADFIFFIFLDEVEGDHVAGDYAFVSFSHQQTLNLGIPQTENALSTGIDAIEHLHKYTFRMNFHDN
ncbi:hypothetical protein GQX74_005154 [Glossina fuscipes]|nr:hypothetical protein GQX74_005154 [Glossina fuscipes]